MRFEDRSRGFSDHTWAVGFAALHCRQSSRVLEHCVAGVQALTGDKEGHQGKTPDSSLGVREEENRLRGPRRRELKWKNSGWRGTRVVQSGN